MMVKIDQMFMTQEKLDSKESRQYIWNTLSPADIFKAKLVYAEVDNSN